jgi:hypothetical protein
MMVVAFGKQSWLECTAFALAFSFSVEVICHRAKGKKLKGRMDIHSSFPIV